MAIHLAGFWEDQDAAAAFVGVAALADDQVQTQGDDLTVPSLSQVILLAGGADDAVAPRIRLTSPTLQAGIRPEISPLNVATAADVEPGSPQALMDVRNNPIQLGVDEILNVDLFGDSAAAQMQWALAWLADEVPQPITGAEIITVRATSATALVAEVWSSVNIVLDENLIPGDYALVGMRPMSAGCVAARVVFRGEGGWRPGALGVDAISDIQANVFRAGNLGVWGTFPFNQLPAIEFLSITADAAQEVYLDLVRI